MQIKKLPALGLQQPNCWITFRFPGRYFGVIEAGFAEAFTTGVRTLITHAVHYYGDLS